MEERPHLDWVYNTQAMQGMTKVHISSEMRSGKRNRSRKGTGKRKGGMVAGPRRTVGPT